ncbi:MAG: hypothetical protein LBM17_08945 [Candidatus Accumulibacter sp.]|nr:hypothetical protein [Accumulibacter sp.]
MRVAKKDQLKKQAIRAADRKRVPDEVREMKTGEFIAKEAEVEPIGQVAERQEFPCVRAFKQKLMDFGPGSIAQEVIIEREIEVIVCKV